MKRKIVYLFLIALMLSSCATLNRQIEEPFDGLATVQINLIHKFRGSIIRNAPEVVLTNNKTYEVVGRAFIIQGRIKFENIPAGVHTLSLRRSGAVIYNNITVDQSQITQNINVTSMYEVARTISIQNHTTSDILSFYINTDYTRNQNRFMVDDYGFQFIVFGGINYGIIRHIRLNSRMFTFTKYDIPFREDITVVITDDDFDDERIRHPRDLRSLNRFPVQISIGQDSGGHHVRVWSHFWHYSHSNLMINGELINCLSLNNRRFNFKSSETYRFDIMIDHPDILVQETIYFTMLPEMIIDWSELIGEEPKTLEWEFYPRNNQFIKFSRLNIDKSISSTEHRYIERTVFSYQEFLPSYKREFLSPIEVNDRANKARINIRFENTNYATSGAVMIVHEKTAGATYREGVLLFTR
jgi:hypothetical protein